MKKVSILILLLCLILTGCHTKKYTVTFMDEDNLLSSIEVNKGEDISDLGIPEKEGYIFVSWYKDGLEYDNETPIDEDITLTASWTKKPELFKNYTVTFNYGDFVKTKTIREGEFVEKPEKAPKKDKYTFLGWYVADTLYDFNQPVTKDLIIVAKYEKNRIIISYDLSGGTGKAQVEINKGTIPTKPENPSKFGYDFTGWTIGSEKYNFDKPLYSDTTIKANWAATVYVKVTFDSDGGSLVNNQYLSSGSKITNLPVPVKEGYTFKYWALGNQAFDKNSTINQDITLVAVYEENNVPAETPTPSNPDIDNDDVNN